MYFIRIRQQKLATAGPSLCYRCHSVILLARAITSLLPNISSKTDHSNVIVASDKQSNIQTRIQTDSILRILHNQLRPNGFFIDCCGNDDKESLSITSYIEKTLRWQGLFIKVNQQLHLLSHNRQFFSLPICLSPESFPPSRYGRVLKNINPKK